MKTKRPESDYPPVTTYTEKAVPRWLERVEAERRRKQWVRQEDRRKNGLEACRAAALAEGGIQAGAPSTKTEVIPHEHSRRIP